MSENIILPPCRMQTVHQKFRTQYGQIVNGSLEVINFRDDGGNGFSLQNIRDYSNKVSRDFARNLGLETGARQDMKFLVWVGVQFPFGYKSSFFPTELGQDVNIWTPQRYDPPPDVVDAYMASKSKMFDVYIMMVPKNGRGLHIAKNTDCFFYTLKVLTGGRLPKQINKPKKLKQWFGVERTDGIPWDHPKMPELEKLLGSCNLFITGDADYKSHLFKHQKYQYYLNLKAGHYTPLHEPGRKGKLGYTYFKDAPVMLKYGYEVFDGETLQTMTSEELTTMWKTSCVNVLGKPPNDLLQWKTEYDNYADNIEALKEATSYRNGYQFQVDMRKCKDINNAIMDLFHHTTYGLPEPAPIELMEGKLHRATDRHGLIFSHKYSGPCWKYDFVSRYPSIMTGTKCMPVGPGEFTTITQEEMDIKAKWKHTPKYGLYNCQVLPSEDERIDCFFNFSDCRERDWYWHEDLEIAIMLGLKIIMDVKHNNAYIYPRDVLVPLNRIFDNYVNYLFPLKQKGIKLAKVMLNNLTGLLSKRKKNSTVNKAGDKNIPAVPDTWSFRAPKRIDDETFQMNYDDTVDPFVYNWGRLHSPLTAMARNKMAKFLWRHKDAVVYCNTDGFVLSEQLKTDIPFSCAGLHGLRYEGHIEHLEVRNCASFRKVEWL